MHSDGDARGAFLIVLFLAGWLALLECDLLTIGKSKVATAAKEVTAKQCSLDTEPVLSQVC